MNRVLDFCLEVKREVAKITWASRRDVMSCFVLVFSIVLLFSLFFYLFDVAVARLVVALLEAVYGRA